MLHRTVVNFPARLTLPAAKFLTQGFRVKSDKLIKCPCKYGMVASFIRQNYLKRKNIL